MNKIFKIIFFNYNSYPGDSMNFDSFATPVLLIFLILISISTACAEEISDANGLDAQDQEFSIETYDSPNNLEETNQEDLSNIEKDNHTLKSDEEYLEIDYPQTHDESHNIIVDAKPSGNKGKTGDEINYTITITNNNPFTVHVLEVFSPEDPDHFWLRAESTSPSDRHVGLLDETAWIIDRLGPGETLIIYAILKVEDVGKTELSLSLSHSHPPYEYISYDDNNEKSNKNTEKINEGNSVKNIKINPSNEKTANPIALLILSLCSIFILNIKNRK